MFRAGQASIKFADEVRRRARTVEVRPILTPRARGRMEIGVDAGCR
jgi:hypothetical protein